MGNNCCGPDFSCLFWNQTEVVTAQCCDYTSGHWSVYLKKVDFEQAPLAHTCNPSSRGRDQEDHGLKPSQANSLWNSVLKTLHKNRDGGVAWVKVSILQKKEKVDFVWCISPKKLKSKTITNGLFYQVSLIYISCHSKATVWWTLPHFNNFHAF
jgi:hypothetical protein